LVETLWFVVGGSVWVVETAVAWKIVGGDSSIGIDCTRDED